jgi:hypothetical protein
MKLTRISKAGLVLIVLGLLIFVGFAVWAKSIRTTVMDIPVPMRAEAVSRDFAVDYDAIYTMWVRFDRGIPLDAARCLLGAQKSELHADLNCKNTLPLLKFSWELSRDGKNGAEGSSADMGSSSTADGSPSVSIFSFPLKRSTDIPQRLNLNKMRQALRYRLQKFKSNWTFSTGKTSSGWEQRSIHSGCSCVWSAQSCC